MCILIGGDIVVIIQSILKVLIQTMDNMFNIQCAPLKTKPIYWICIYICFLVTENFKFVFFLITPKIL